MSIVLPPESGCAPENTESHGQQIAVLASLSNSGCQLEHDEVQMVLNSVPLLVLADDEPCMRTIIFRIMTGGRGQETITTLKGDIQECFDSLPKMPEGQLPVILCENGAQANTAAHIICERKIEDGILIFDHMMGSPEGLKIFKQFRGEFSPRITKALFTGTPPADTGECLNTGVIDAAIIKPCDKDKVRAKLAETYLRKKFGSPNVNRSA